MLLTTGWMWPALKRQRPAEIAWSHEARLGADGVSARSIAEMARMGLVPSRGLLDALAVLREDARTNP